MTPLRTQAEPRSGVWRSNRARDAMVAMMVAAMAIIGHAEAAAQSPTMLEADIESVVHAGHVTIRWNAPRAHAEFQLQEVAQDGATATRYQGHDRAMFVSGLLDGTYRYRVRSRGTGDERWSDWSAPRTVVVAHHSLALALTLFGIGALVFAATARFILTRRDE